MAPAAVATLWLVLMGTLRPEIEPRTAITASTRHLTIQAIVEPEAVTPGSTLTIVLTVSPARGIHVYAPGSGYRAVAVSVDPQPGVTPQKLTYPPSAIYYFEPLDERVPVYSAPFTLKQVVRVSTKALKGKAALTLSGRLEYQACDDRVCYKPDAIAFEFEVPRSAVRRPSPAGQNTRAASRRTL